MTKLPDQKWNADVTGPKGTCEKEPIYLAYYRTWRDVAIQKKADDQNVNVIKMTDIPSGIDFVSLFHVEDNQESDRNFWQTFDSEYHPALKARGTQVLRTIGMERLLKEMPEKSAVDEEFIKAAKKVVDEYVGKHDLAGLDVDVEGVLSSDDQWRMKKTFRALSLFLGPKSNSNKLLIFDTDKGVEASYFSNAAAYVDYLLFQAYGSRGDALNQTWFEYQHFISSCQFIPGYANSEENDTVNKWNDAVGTDIENSRAVAKAKWQPPRGIKGGLFNYAIDRDGLDTTDPVTMTDFRFTNRTIELTKGKKQPEATQPPATQQNTKPKAPEQPSQTRGNFFGSLSSALSSASGSSR